MTNASTDLVDGCHVIVGSDAIVSGTSKAGEHNRVVKVVATGTTPSHRIILEKHTRYDYNTADTAWIRRVDFLENIHLEGFTIAADPAGLANNTAFMRADFAYGLHMKDVYFKDWAVWNSNTFHSCLIHNTVVNSDCSDLMFEQSPERGHPTGENPTGYAISSRAASETVYYRNIRFIGFIRHCYTTTSNNETAKNGAPRNIWLINCNAETNSEAGFDTHSEGDGINFINCSVHSSRKPIGTDTTAGTADTDAFASRCKNTRMIGCSVYNNNGLAFSIQGSGSVIENCYAREIFRSSPAFNVNASNCAVRNCYAENIDNEGITVSGSASDVQIVGNTIVDTGATDGAITVQTGCTRVQVNNNIIKTVVDEGILLQGTNNDCTINGNIISSAAGSAIKVVSSNNVVVTGNQIKSCNRALEMTGTSDYIIYTNNNARSNTNAKITVGSNNVIANNQE
jgi:hypothetical protein